MKKEDFEKRVDMTVSGREFRAINEVYLSCDVSVTEEEFCDHWMVLNRHRIAVHNRGRMVSELPKLCADLRAGIVAYGAEASVEVMLDEGMKERVRLTKTDVVDVDKWLSEGVSGGVPYYSLGKVLENAEDRLRQLEEEECLTQK